MWQFHEFCRRNDVGHWLYMWAGILGTGRRSMCSLCIGHVQERFWECSLFLVWS